MTSLINRIKALVAPRELETFKSHMNRLVKARKLSSYKLGSLRHILGTADHKSLNFGTIRKVVVTLGIKAEWVVNIGAKVPDRIIWVNDAFPDTDEGVRSTAYTRYVDAVYASGRSLAQMQKMGFDIRQQRLPRLGKLLEVSRVLGIEPEYLLCLREEHDDTR